MKLSKLITTLLLTGCGLQAFAQQQLIHPKEHHKQAVVARNENQPYIQVNGQQTVQPSLILFSPETIESVEVHKDANATNKFGKKAKDSAILIQTKPGVTLARLQDIYTHFAIPSAQQNLKVVINSKLIRDTNLILADLNMIEHVQVVKQEVTAPVRWSLNDEEEFLHIIPKKQEK
ncbi:hypothetical protein OB13_05095 [Pontibacter sp. HJ8]